MSNSVSSQQKLIVKYWFVSYTANTDFPAKLLDLICAFLKNASVYKSSWSPIFKGEFMELSNNNLTAYENSGGANETIRCVDPLPNKKSKWYCKYTSTSKKWLHASYYLIGVISNLHSSSEFAGCAHSSDDSLSLTSYGLCNNGRMKFVGKGSEYRDDISDKELYEVLTIELNMEIEIEADFTDVKKKQLTFKHKNKLIDSVILPNKVNNKEIKEWFPCNGICDSSIYCHIRFDE